MEIENFVYSSEEEFEVVTLELKLAAYFSKAFLTQ